MAYLQKYWAQSKLGVQFALSLVDSTGLAKLPPSNPGKMCFLMMALYVVLTICPRLAQKLHGRYVDLMKMRMLPGITVKADTFMS